MLNHSVLTDYVHGFFGYGTWNANYWFVGMEEAGGVTIDEVSKRLTTWVERGRTAIDDLVEFLRQADLTDWFEPSSRAQTTWHPLIRSVLVSQNKSDDAESILNYQRTKLGRATGETAILENLPLPSPDTRMWKYAKWSSIPTLGSRAIYQRTYLKPRADQILELIRIHRPKVVVFYGNRQSWSKRLSLAPSGKYTTNAGRWRDSFVVATDHTGARTNDAAQRFDEIGKLIRQNCTFLSESA